MSISAWRHKVDALAKLDAEIAARRAWIDDIAARHGVVRLAESITPAEREAQQDRIDYALGRKFLTTTPLPGFRIEHEWPAVRVGTLW